ncbi:hypothetical protein ACFL20_09405 [Spirochaetota bacterium]
MSIEYHRPSHYERRKQAGFWAGAGNFFVTALSGYVILLVLIFILKLIIAIKILKLLFN